jgi:hypothetical protein
MITFEVIDASTADQLAIHLDKQGLADLLAQLKFLADGKTDHVHLMAESWGGSHLREEPISSGAVPIRHVKVCLV